MGNAWGLIYVPSGGTGRAQRDQNRERAGEDVGEGKKPNPLYDAPHDIGHQYLQWALHLEKIEPRWSVTMLPSCFHCSGNAPCTAKVCINCLRPR